MMYADRKKEKGGTVFAYHKEMTLPLGLMLASLIAAVTILPATAQAADNEVLFIPGISVGRSSLSFARSGSALPDVTDRGVLVVPIIVDKLTGSEKEIKVVRTGLFHFLEELGGVMQSGSLLSAFTNVVAT